MVVHIDWLGRRRSKTRAGSYTETLKALWANDGALSLLIGLAMLVSFFAMNGCATARGVTGYDGVPDIPPTNGDSVSLVHVTIDNVRTNDATDPMIYIVAGGMRNPLGRIGGMGGQINKWIDPSWLGSDGCFTIVAHYTMDPELRFDQFCWKRGEQIVATLMDPFHTNAMWSHR